MIHKLDKIMTRSFLKWFDRKYAWVTIALWIDFGVTVMGGPSVSYLCRLKLKEWQTGKYDYYND